METWTRIPEQPKWAEDVLRPTPTRRSVPIDNVEVDLRWIHSLINLVNDEAVVCMVTNIKRGEFLGRLRENKFTPPPPPKKRTPLPWASSVLLHLSFVTEWLVREWPSWGHDSDLARADRRFVGSSCVSESFSVSGVNSNLTAARKRIQRRKQKKWTARLLLSSSPLCPQSTIIFVSLIARIFMVRTRWPLSSQMRGYSERRMMSARRMHPGQLITSVCLSVSSMFRLEIVAYMHVFLARPTNHQITQLSNSNLVIPLQKMIVVDLAKTRVDKDEFNRLNIVLFCNIRRWIKFINQVMYVILPSLPRSS